MMSPLIHQLHNRVHWMHVQRLLLFTYHSLKGFWCSFDSGDVFCLTGSGRVTGYHRHSFQCTGEMETLEDLQPMGLYFRWYYCVICKYMIHHVHIHHMLHNREDMNNIYS